MECFSIDESGYTGFDLLNVHQRFQGASAVCIAHNDAQYLIKEHFPKLQADELKYSSLVRRSGNLQKLLNLQQDLLRNYKCVTYVCNKRYLLILMFLDYAAEPYYFARGLNFYEEGQNYTLGSLLYYTGNSLWGPGFDALLSAFQAAVKLKTHTSIDKLILAAQCLNWEKLPEALGPLASRCPDCISAITTEGVTTDAAFIVLQALINRMELMASGAYRVDHDKSKNLLQYHDILEQFINHKNMVEFRQSEIANIKFPLKLTSVSQVDSKECPSIQMADILIGAAIDVSNSLTGLKERSKYTERVISLYTDEQIIHMLPTLDFEEQKKFRRGSQANQVIDYFGKHFFS